MSRLQWHPRYHRDALDGMERMSLEDRGAYTTLLDMMYDRAGPVPDEDRMLAGQMLVSVRAWKIIRARLIESGKIEVVQQKAGPSLMATDGLEVPVLRLPRHEWEVIRARIFARDGERCTYCLSEQGPFEIDHAYPVIRGGSHDDGNLVVSCRSCNRSKGAKTVEEWLS